MDAGGHDRATYWAGPVVGPTRRTQTQVPAWQQQHARFPHPTPPATTTTPPPPPTLAGAGTFSGGFRLLLLLLSGVLRPPLLDLPPHIIAPAARFRVVHGRAGSGLPVVADVGQELLQVAAQGIGGGFVGPGQVLPYLILNAQAPHSVLEDPVQLSHPLYLFVFLLQLPGDSFLDGRHQHSSLPLPLLVQFHPHFLGLQGKKNQIINKKNWDFP